MTTNYQAQTVASAGKNETSIQTPSPKRRFFRRLTIAFSLLLLSMLTSTAYAQKWPYEVHVRTADEANSRSLLTHKIYLVGDKGVSGWRTLKNAATDGHTDETKLMINDIGVVRTIYLKNEDAFVVDFHQTWQVDTVLVKTPNGPNPTAHTESVFNVGEWLGVVPMNSPNKTSGMYHAAAVTGGPVVQTGEYFDNPVEITSVDFRYNHTSVDEPVSQQEENWSKSHETGYSTTQSTTKSTVLEANFSLDVPFGGGGGSVSQGWESTFETAKSETTTVVQGFQHNWGFTAPSYSWCFRKVRYLVPQKYVQYRDTNQRSAWVRSIGNPIILKEERFLEVPTKWKLDNGLAQPASWNNIEHWFLNDLSREDYAEVMSLKQQWLRDGVIFEEGQSQGGGQPQGGSGQPQGTQPEVTSTYVMTLRIRCAGNERTLHVGEDNMVSTKSEANDDSARFDLERCTDGSYRLKSKGNGRYLWVFDANGGDQNLSTRLGLNMSEYTKFIFEQQSDNSYRIKLQKTNRYLHVNGYDSNQLANTEFGEANDAFTRFELLQP